MESRRAEAPWGDAVTGPRAGRMRDRRGRGQRGIRGLPGPLTPVGLPSRTSPRAEFDEIVTQIVTELGPAFRAETETVEVVVEDVPRLPREWDDPVPTSIVNRNVDPVRLVLFRLPTSERAVDRRRLEEITWTVLLEQLAAVWQVSPDDLDPR